LPAVCQVAAYLVSCICLPLHPKTLRSAVDRVRDLPCWRAAVRPRVLGGGLSNHNFVVEDGGARFVARIGGDAPAHNVMRFNEASCARAAAAVGLAPRVVHAADGALVIDFIDGRTLDAAAVRDMLARYYGAPVDNAAWRRYKALRAASHLRETLWSMTAEIVSDIEHDYATYTEDNLADFAQAFEAFEMAGSG